MNLLYNSDKEEITRKSSIDQFSSFLSVYRQGGAVPVSFDVIDSITCEGIKSHKAIVKAGGDYNGFVYPVAHCTKNEVSYLTSDRKGLVEKDLPPCQGKGKYLYPEDISVITNADNEALGTANRIHYRVGLDYYQSKHTLPAV